jgi:hypothetical protein
MLSYYSFQHYFLFGTIFHRLRRVLNRRSKKCELAGPGEHMLFKGTVA